MRNLWIIGLVMLLGACVAPPEAEEDLTQPPTLELSETVEVAETPLPTADEPTAAPMGSPTATATVEANPSIGAIRFLAPSGESQGIPTYPADVQSVGVEIPFSGLAGEMIVRREWLLDGAAWLDVEELWPAQWRGAEGVWPITLSGQMAALRPGTYELRVYIDGEPKFDPADAASRSFVVQAPADGSNPAQPPPDYRGIRIPAPDGERTALVIDWGTIVLLEADGSQRTLVTGHTIGDLAWFPDGQYLVYRDLLPEGETDNFLGNGSQLYVLNVETGAVTRIGRADERWRSPQVSPDGTMIAVVGGSGFSDACMTDLTIGVIRLDENKQRLDVLNMRYFAGLPGADFGVWRMSWIGETQLEVEMAFWCLETLEVNGTYTFDIVAQTAVQTATTNPEDTPLLGSYITFTTDPGSQQSDVRLFPAGTDRIYALVYYQGMRDGVLFRREWYLNGELWLTREEPWDFAKYGATGTLTDLSIFDETAGLPPGTYELRLYLDGVPQFDTSVGFGQRSFVIEGES